MCVITLPKIEDARAYQTTPLLVIHILLAFSHDPLAAIIKTAFPSLSDAQVFDRAKSLNTYIFQRVLYEYLLPDLLGPVATSHYSIDSTDNCYDASNTLEVPVETIIVALRYCHAYIPEEYELLKSNYDFFDKQNLDTKLSPEAVDQFFGYILRGLFATNVLKDNYSQCSTANNYAQPPQGYKDDLRALDIQAARDACVEPYLQYLTNVYNVSAKNGWNDYKMFFGGNNINLLSTMYGSPQEIELAVGGALETHHQSVFGDLFKIFISNFFSDLRCSDPDFWTNALSGSMTYHLQ